MKSTQFFKFLTAAFLISSLTILIGCKKDDIISYSDLAYGNMSDQDGNTYRTIKIGNQLWMAENLKVTHYSNGDIITQIKEQDDWRHLSTGAYSIYDGNENNMKKYGLLYNGYAIKDERKIAPVGWHVPTESDWCELIYFMDSVVECYDFKNSEKDVISMLKSADGWQYNAGSNVTGFSAIPGGFISISGPFNSEGEAAYWWSSAINDKEDRAKSFSISNYSGGALVYNYLGFGFSVRCIKD